MLQKSTGIYFSQDNGHNVFAINYCFMFSRKQLTAVVQAANLLVMDKSNLKVALVHVRIWLYACLRVPYVSACVHARVCVCCVSRQVHGCMHAGVCECIIDNASASAHIHTFVYVIQKTFACTFVYRWSKTNEFFDVLEGGWHSQRICAFERAANKEDIRLIYSWHVRFFVILLILKIHIFV